MFLIKPENLLDIVGGPANQVRVLFHLTKLVSTWTSGSAGVREAAVLGQGHGSSVIIEGRTRGCRGADIISGMEAGSPMTEAMRLMDPWPRPVAEPGRRVTRRVTLTRSI